MSSNNNLQPSDNMFGNSQSSGYESMPDPFYSEFQSSQEMGPPPIPDRFQQQPNHPQQPPITQAQPMQSSMDRVNSPVSENQSWQQSQQPQQPESQTQSQQPASQPPAPQPQFRLQTQQSSTTAPSQPKVQPTAPTPPATTQPQFVLNNNQQPPPTTASSNSRSNTPIQADKTRINVLRQQVLHPVDPKIVEKMHKLPPAKSKDNAAEMLLRMKDFESVIPDSAAKYMMTRSGTAVDDDICYRMLAISAQKFASDILSDAFNIILRSMVASSSFIPGQFFRIVWFFL